MAEGELTGNSMGLEMLAQQSLATTAVEALSAKLRVVGADTLANFKTLHRLSDSSNDTNSLVACSNVRQNWPNVDLDSYRE